eukprot:XP_014788368.1 PREDICTED: uncharacterized protein LOC106882268 isoform X2 [Octopus bimaculoides]
MSTILTANIPYLLFTFPLQMRAVLIIMLILPVIPTDAEVYPSCKGCMVVGECVCGRAFWVTITKHDCMKKECQWSSVFWKEVGIYIDCDKVYDALKDPKRYAPEGVIHCKNDN